MHVRKFWNPLSPPVQNFVKNSFNVRDKRTLGELWEAFSGAASTQQVV